MIAVEKLSKSYGESLILDNVDLTLAKGGVTSIIGPNGAGKSTLLSTIARLLPMDSGTVTVDGLDVTRARSDMLATRLAILRQDNSLAARLTVADLVSFGRYPHNKGRPVAGDREHVRRALDYLGLTDLRERFLDELSGGQRQRAFIAMVLCQDSNYMLFDEPLNNLDIRHAASIMQILRSAARDFDKTVVVVLHDINFASCYSDHIVAMRDGKVFAQGSPETLIQADLLSSLYACAFEVHEIKGERIAVYY